MSVLSSDARRELERACVSGRRSGETASRAAITALGVLEDRPPAHLSDSNRELRRGLRAKSDQLGDAPGRIELLVADCAYEQWHRLLFARFLAENDLLIHPQFEAPVTLAECADLAASLDEPDAWGVASRFAAEILPGIFRLDDPCVKLRLAPEGRLALEQIVESISAETFVADDALGWVYQYWQRERKDEVNDSERKIGGADLAPVTQLFTENYMVRFLLENSLGAWWAGRHPGSALLRDWKYLRYDGDGKPAAGTFEGWPEAASEVTVIDPCCGSGHFLVEAFGMLWQMRAEEENLEPVDAQDAVLSDNLFGLELDPRCVQIGIFAVAMAAWRAGGGWRQLPIPNVACSGLPVKAPLAEWQELARGDVRLASALTHLHSLFQDAESLGSLINPRHAGRARRPVEQQGSLDDVSWASLAPFVEAARADDEVDPAALVLGTGAVDVARSADLLARRYTLVCTNPPFLGRSKQSEKLTAFADKHWKEARSDLALMFLRRAFELCCNGGSVAMVEPQTWLQLKRSEELRTELLLSKELCACAWLGARAFEAIVGHVVTACLVILNSARPRDGSHFLAIDCQADKDPRSKSKGLVIRPFDRIAQADQLENPESRILPSRILATRLSLIADSHQGIKTSDNPRFVRFFWERAKITGGWRRMQSAPERTEPYTGRSEIAFWEDGYGVMTEVCQEGATFRGKAAWNRRGVVIREMGSLPATLYTGELFDGTGSVITAHDDADLPALWAFCQSSELAPAVRSIDTSLKVSSGTLLSVPIDLDFWRRAAAQAGPLPSPTSLDPTQWLFRGRPEDATESLQVAVCRLLGYGWPDQPDDDLDQFSDRDGIVCLPSVLGERPASDRLQDILAKAFGGTWSPARARELLAAAGSEKDLDSWLRDEFFKAHCQLFKNRPFVWHVWDGRKDGFSALLNYHRLDRATLERITYTYLGDWMERQAAAARENATGAEERLIAARALQRKLELIIAGEPPYDIYVRWKAIAQQPIGWGPDLDDGVRLNVRPFVQAGVLRAKFNVKWEKDRGKNPDGSERHNDVHVTSADKQAARAR